MKLPIDKNYDQQFYKELQENEERLKRIQHLMDLDPLEGTRQGNEFIQLVAETVKWEGKHYHFDKPTREQIIAFRRGNRHEIRYSKKDPRKNKRSNQK